MANTNIQFYNNQQLTYDDETLDKRITFGTATGSTTGMTIQYDRLTTPKTFEIKPTGISWTDGVTPYTTSLNRIAAVQTALQAVELPANATTLKINHTLLASNGVNNITVDASNNVITAASFSGTATNSNNVLTTSDNTSGNYYLPFVKTSGTGNKALFIDDTTGPTTVNPNTGEFRVANTLKIDPTNTNIFMGTNAGTTNQGANSVAIGNLSGTTNQGANSFALGNGAGNNTQGTSAVAIGVNAGQTSQGNFTVAIGNAAGNNTQGVNSTAIGANAGQTTQGVNAVAIGINAGQTSQGATSIAIGSGAGQTNQHANSIVINASGSALNTDGTSRTFIGPVRNDTTKQNQVQYNSTTKELSYVAQVVSPITTGGLDLTGNAALLSATAGGSAGTHLVVVVNGVTYKIALLNA